MALNFHTPPTSLSEPTCAPSAVWTATAAALMGSNCKGPASGPGGMWVKVGVKVSGRGEDGSIAVSLSQMAWRLRRGRSISARCVACCGCFADRSQVSLCTPWETMGGLHGSCNWSLALICLWRPGVAGGYWPVPGPRLGHHQSLRLTPRLSSFFAYESLRFTAFAAVSVAAWTALGPLFAAALIHSLLFFLLFFF